MRKFKYTLDRKSLEIIYIAFFRPILEHADVVWDNYTQQEKHQLEKIQFVTKTCLYNFDPHKPYFYIVKLRFTGVYIIFLISAQKHRLWVLVRTASPRRF